MLRQSGFVCLLIGALPVLSQVTVSDGLSYSNLNPARVFRMFYPAGTPNSATLPIVVYIHGGGWNGGGRNDSHVTPSVCNTDDTIACWLGDHGYVVFAIDYTLVNRIASGADLTVVAWHTVSAASHSFTKSDVGATITVLENG